MLTSDFVLHARWRLRIQNRRFSEERGPQILVSIGQCHLYMSAPDLRPAFCTSCCFF